MATPDQFHLDDPEFARFPVPSDATRPMARSSK
jgi:hypothetical protein